ncbi:phosphatidylinositol kinase [Ferrimicrobium sp.]|uniref:phosphatidylinositol kinase n=1 Tax=Ferrimicrobium sp. TaxID=2926050 RepID=UPI00262CE9B7|nr:phosphatidylinositol kinase [Ferrimicrobium sp.]
MPENQRPSSSEPLATEAELTASEVKILGRIEASSNGALLVELESGRRGIYKPESLERPLWDFTAGLYRRERASYLLARQLMLDFIPPIVVRDDLPLGRGSLQSFIDADFNLHYFDLYDEADLRDRFIEIAAFDMVANNADRKAGHLLLDQRRHLWGIDNALCFHAEPKLRTVIWEFGGAPVDQTLLDAMTQAADHLDPEFTQLLSQRERRTLMHRLRVVASMRELIDLDVDERPYPWPLI